MNTGAVITHEDKKIKTDVFGAQAAQDGIEALAAFIREIGLPTTFAELGIPEDTDLKAVAESTSLTAGCCKKLTHDEIYEILMECK